MSLCCVVSRERYPICEHRTCCVCGWKWFGHESFRGSDFLIEDWHLWWNGWTYLLINRILCWSFLWRLLQYAANFKWYYDLWGIVRVTSGVSRYRDQKASPYGWMICSLFGTSKNTPSINSHFPTKFQNTGSKLDSPRSMHLLGHIFGLHPQWGHNRKGRPDQK